MRAWFMVDLDPLRRYRTKRIMRIMTARAPMMPPTMAPASLDLCGAGGEGGNRLTVAVAVAVGAD